MQNAFLIDKYAVGLMIKGKNLINNGKNVLINKTEICRHFLWDKNV